MALEKKEDTCFELVPHDITERVYPDVVQPSFSAYKKNKQNARMLFVYRQCFATNMVKKIIESIQREDEGREKTKGRK